MKNYWGTRESGRRKGFGYVPKLYGFVFYKAKGVHPLRINEKSIAEFGSPKFVGYSLGKDRLPTYDYKAGKHSISVKVSPDRPLKLFVLISLPLPMKIWILTRQIPKLNKSKRNPEG